MKNLFQIIILTYLAMFVQTSAPAHPAWGIQVDKQKNIYFADIMHKGRGAVWKLSSGGQLELLLEDFHAHNVALDKNGHLITAHGENTYYLLKIGPEGRKDTLVFKDNHRDFNGGNCTYSEDGRVLFYADKHVWEIVNGQQKRKISDYNIQWAQTIYGDENGNTYVPEIGDGKGQLIKIDESGYATVMATNLISKLDRPYEKHNDILLGITKGCDGNMYICELAGQRVIKILPNQKKETFYTSEGDWFPSGIDFSSGDAYIMEYKGKGGNAGPRIIMINEAGQKSVLFEYGEDSQKEVVPVMPGGTTWKKGLVLKILILLLMGFAAFFAFKRKIIVVS